MSWIEVELDLTAERLCAHDSYVRAAKSRIVHIAEMEDSGEWATEKTLCGRRVGTDWLVSENDYSSYSAQESEYKCCPICFRRAYW